MNMIVYAHKGRNGFKNMKERIIMSNIHLLESDWDKLMEKTGTQTARNFEFVINNMPLEVQVIKLEIKEIKKILKSEK